MEESHWTNSVQSKVERTSLIFPLERETGIYLCLTGEMKRVPVVLKRKKTAHEVGEGRPKFSTKPN